MITLSLQDARRLAVAAQAFGPKPARPTRAHLRRLAAQLHAFQIDSVNVLVRAHYVPAFARLGPYPMGALDTLAYDRRELFEFWGHAACLMPVSLYPLLRYRVDKHQDLMQAYLRSRRGAYMARVYAEVADRGPLAAAELSHPGRRTGPWWGWSAGKDALESLFHGGLVAIAGRRGFERLYDLTERVIPNAVLDASVPAREDAMKHLICLGAKACGVGTLRDLTGYFEVDGWYDRLPAAWWARPTRRRGRRSTPIAPRLVAELVDAGRLLPARVDGWKDQAYVHPEARPPKAVEARALVTPFDSLVWAHGQGTENGVRSRLLRLFGMKYTLEIYVPPPKRVYGYYVLPFLLGDTLVARCDLKADRRRRILMVQGSFLEPGHDARRVVGELTEELRQMASWLELDGIEVAPHGDLASRLRRAV